MGPGVYYSHTGGKQVEVRVCGEYPESVMLSPKGLDCSALCQIPYAHCLVFTARYNELMFWMEERIGDVIEMPPASVDLPGLCFAHPPYLDRTIIGGGDNQGESRMEGAEIDTSVMALEDVFYSGKRVESLEIVRSGAGSALSQTRYVPNAYGLIHGCGHDKIVLWMELGGHDIMRVTSEDGDAIAGGAVPYAYSLVVGC